MWAIQKIVIFVNYIYIIALIFNYKISSSSHEVEDKGQKKSLTILNYVSISQLKSPLVTSTNYFSLCPVRCDKSSRKV